MVLGRYYGCSLVDASVGLEVYLFRDFVLRLRVRYDFLVLQEQLLGYAVLATNQFVVSSSTSESTFF